MYRRIAQRVPNAVYAVVPRVTSRRLHRICMQTGVRTGTRTQSTCRASVSNKATTPKPTDVCIVEESTDIPTHIKILLIFSSVYLIGALSVEALYFNNSKADIEKYGTREKQRKPPRGYQ